MVRFKRSINTSKYLQFFRLSCNIQTLFYWGQKGELYTNYHIRLISYYKDLKTKVVPWFSLVIGENANRQLATSSEKLVASVQFLVVLVTSESQFQALAGHNYTTTILSPEPIHFRVTVSQCLIFLTTSKPRNI